MFLFLTQKLSVAVKFLGYMNSAENSQINKESIRGCPINHEGQLVFSVIVPLAVDDAFTLLFTHSRFMENLMETMEYTELRFDEWEDKLENSTYILKRKNTFVVPVKQNLGPKVCQVTETQVLKICQPGQLYEVEAESINAGVPYCDKFSVFSQFCLSALSLCDTSLTVYCHIRFKKPVMVIIKKMIEKNVWAGIMEYYDILDQHMKIHCIKRMTRSEVHFKMPPPGVVAPRSCQCTKYVCFFTAVIMVLIFSVNMLVYYGKI